MKKILFLLLAFIPLPVSAAYQYTYIPKTFSATVYNLLYGKREKCAVGEKKDYPDKIGACVSCPDGSFYSIDETQNKAFCFKCPTGTLLVKRNGYPMCLSNYPVIDGTAKKNPDTPVSPEELESIVLRLSAEYKTVSSVKPKQNEKTFKNKEKLINVCPYSYPEDETAEKQIEICRRLAGQNDFLCPYVEKDAEGKWICRACTKNAPYKSKRGGCFNCPYGEEMTALEDGTPVCASEAPSKPKKKLLPEKSGKTAAKRKRKAGAVRKAAKKRKK